MADKKVEEEKVENIKEKVESKKTETKKVEEEKVKIRIPIDPLNPKDKEVIVGINEKYAKVVRGEETEVTKPVFEQLRNAGLV